MIRENRSLSPLFLSVGVPVSSNIVTLDSTSLLNPNRTPMLIDEFRFLPADVTYGGVPTGNSGSVGANLQFKINLGNMPLTNNFVSALTVMPSPIYASAVWHLPKPLWVPPNVVLGVQLRMTSGSTTPIQFSIAGRSVASGVPNPKQIYAPWAASAIQPVLTTASTRWVTPDNALGNPFAEPMVLTRLSGITSFGSVSSTNRTVKLTLSNGKMLVRDPVPFDLLFPQGGGPALNTVGAGIGVGYLDISGVLQPREFIRGIIDYESMTSASNQLGMVGYHVIDTPQGS